jgi:hypothetical protein
MLCAGTNYRLLGDAMIKFGQAPVEAVPVTQTADWQEEMITLISKRPTLQHF